MLAVGVNAPGGSFAPLRYADDDAVAAASFFSPRGENAWLLTLPDVETAQQSRQLLAHARPPTRQALQQAVKEITARVARDNGSGGAPVVVVWLVGHGGFQDDGGAFFALADDNLSPDGLLEDVLRPLASAHRVHLVIDACHAGALVRSRALVQSADSAEIERVWHARTPASLANVGIIAAASPGERAWEWDEIRGGVFSALVRSGMSGAADVDADDGVSYPELAAYLTAAVSAVPLPEARPQVYVEGPLVEPLAFMSKAAWLSDRRVLAQDLSALGMVRIDDGSGRFLTGGRFEGGFLSRLWLPNVPLRLVTASSERPIVVEGDGLEVGAEQSDTAAASRGRIDEALRAGLFATPYGPAYFAGFRAAAEKKPPAPVFAKAPKTPWLAIGLLSGAGLSLAAAAGGLFVGVQQNLDYNAGQCVERTCPDLLSRSVAGYVVAGAAAVVGSLLAGGAAWAVSSATDSSDASRR